MVRFSVFVLLLVVMGCGSPVGPATTQQQAGHTPLNDVPNTEESTTCIKNYLQDCGLSKLELVSVSNPVATPAHTTLGWVYSVSSTCENVFGEKQKNNHCLIVLERVEGKMQVRQYYNELAQIHESNLGKEWFVQAGFAEPTIE